MKAGIKITLFLCFIHLSGIAQVKEARIVFERRTNLEKLYGNMEQMKRFVNEDNKIRIEPFELLYNDTASAFLPIEDPTGGPGGWMAYLTTKNKTYSNYNSKQQMTTMDFAGQAIFVEDSMVSREWKITESKRFIAGYNCRKAVYDKNDSTRIYAWFSTEFELSTGPEGLNGLPGVILGLATEDGGIVYFAKEIEIGKIESSKLLYDTGKNDVYTKESLARTIEERMGKSRWSSGMMENLFRW